MQTNQEANQAWLKLMRSNDCGHAWRQVKYIFLQFSALVAPSCFALQDPDVRRSMLKRDIELATIHRHAFWKWRPYKERRLVTLPVPTNFK